VRKVSWAVALACLLPVAAGCTNPLPPLSITLSPATPQAINQAGVANITASVSNDSSKKGVSWAISPSIGSLDSQSTTSVTYRAPTTVAINTIVTITATSLTDAQTSALLLVILLAPGPRNVQPIAVITNPIANQAYINGPFTSVMICAAGTSKCQLIDGILVDTGSVGLRIFKSAVTVPFQTLMQSGGSINDCEIFGGSVYFWGEIASADAYVAGEKASGISFQLVADPTGYDVPPKCSNGFSDGAAVPQFNGILGIGDEPTDCTFAGTSPCDPNSGTASPPVYFVCFGSEGCATTLLPKAQQVSNPIVSFPTDNNGSVIQFPSVGTALSSVNGSLTFGINTETNNDIGIATVFPISPANNSFTTMFGGQMLTQSFIDSGSPELLFPNATGLQVCSNNFFYCPSNAPVMLSAINQGADNTGLETIDFLVDNYSTVTQANPNAAAFGYIAAQNGQPPCQSGMGGCIFDWGLPFFYNRTVFTSIDQQPVAGEPKTPWWAY
jgi:hypothetical protein